LSYTVYPIHRLALNLRVPPGVIEDDGVCGGEGETGAAGLEADEEELSLALLKSVYHLFPTSCRPIEPLVTPAARNHFGTDQL
jgi:hypothetical protein